MTEKFQPYVAGSMKQRFNRNKTKHQNALQTRMSILIARAFTESGDLPHQAQVVQTETPGLTIRRRELEKKIKKPRRHENTPRQKRQSYNNLTAA